MNARQRSMKARWEYIKGMNKIWEKIKKKYKIDDELLLDLFENPCELSPGEEWDIELTKLAKKIEKKYHVYIDHQDDIIHVMAWSK